MTRFTSNRNNLTIRARNAADGSKRRVRYFDAQGNFEKERDYFGGFEYERTADQSNLAMTQFPFSDGSVTKNGFDFVYEYQMKDSQGNVPYPGNIQACLPVGRGSFVWENNVSTPSPDGQTNLTDIGAFAQKQEDYYYPFGLRSMRLDASSGNRYLYNGKELETFHDLSYYDGACPLGRARFYACPACGNPQLGRWHAVDPAGFEKAHLSPYQYCFNNPIMCIDPSGAVDELAPIFDTNGNLLGTNYQGLQGKAIIMDAANFTQGMKHSYALNYSLGYEGLSSDAAKMNFNKVYDNLPMRSDWDGKLTFGEARNWWENGNGKPLYIDESKINLWPIKQSDFSKVGESKWINFASPRYPNFETGLVFGNIQLTLLNHWGLVRIGDEKNKLDTYDFDQRAGASMYRNAATKIGEWINGSGVPFEIFGYGRARIK